MNETAEEISYTALTCVNRVKDFEIPTYISLGGKLTKLPKYLTRKDVHFLVSPECKLVRAAWISKALAHILNSKTMENKEVRLRELERALEDLDSHISSLIKFGVLRDRQGPGAMSFSQANENIPEDAIMISKRSYDELIKHNPRWEHTSHVMVVRFPNLGPGTTQKLRLIVNSEEDSSQLKDTALGKRFAWLGDLLDEMNTNSLEEMGVVDAFYLNPNTLKRTEGDGDGDIIYMVKEQKGHPYFREISLIREPAPIKDSDVETLFAKADRVDRTSLTAWLPNYFDNVPIAPATYAIRWKLFNRLAKFKNCAHPMSSAWKEIAPIGIKLMEFVMDIRKGEFTEAEIEDKMKNINNTMREIKKAKEKGNWFAKTVTSSHVEDVGRFTTDFKSLQKFVNYITGQDKQLTMKDL
jgi:hypothetical protein